MSPNSNNDNDGGVVVDHDGFLDVTIGDGGFPVDENAGNLQTLNGCGCGGQWFWKKGFGWNSTSDTVAERKRTVASLLFFGITDVTGAPASNPYTGFPPHG